MTRFAESYAVWLADFYLLATALLALSLTGMVLIKQPVQRLMVTKSTLLALALLAILCAVPGWSVVHLLAADRAPAIESAREEPMQVVGAVAPTTVQRVGPPVPVPLPADSIVAKASEAKISWTASLAIAHLVGMGCIVAWLTLGWIASIRLRRGAHMAPPSVRAILDELATQNNRDSRPPQLFTHDRIDVAVALGVWRPMILLPRRWTSTQSPDRLRAVLAHESTHILNHDLRWVALTRILLIPLWANPLFWLAKRRLRLDQEALADAAAAEVTSRQQYAEQLVSWARDTRSRPALHLSSAVGLWEGPSQLRQRIAILLDERLTVLRNCSRRWRIAATIFAIGTATALSTVTLQPPQRAEANSPTRLEPNTAKPSAQAKVPTDPVGANQPSTTTTAQPAITKTPPPAARRLAPNTITGRVTDDKGQPLPAADVFLFRINRIDRSRKLQAKTVTDSAGKYRFENVIDIPKEFPDGKLRPLNTQEEEFVQVVVRAPGRTTEMRMDLRQSIATGALFDMKLSPAAKLTGRITGPDGKPVSGALVSVGNSGFTTWEGAASARTGADGTYSIDDVPAYGIEEYKKRAADENHRREALAAKKSPDTYSIYIDPPMISVEHPDFASKTTLYNKIPGQQDVQLELAAIIEGRVALGDPLKPAGRIVVKLNTSPPQEASSNEDYFVPNFFAAETRTDSDGKYRFASLPAGNYDLSAEKPNWVNARVDAFAAASGKTSTPPTLLLTPGGIISIRLINDKTGKPISVGPDTRADISAHEFPLPANKVIAHPSWKPQAAATPAGRFELHAAPGKREVSVLQVYEGQQAKWISKQSRAVEPKVVDVVEGKTVEIDIPVIEMPKDPRAAITGSFARIVPVMPVKVPDDPPNKKPSPGNATK